MGSLEFIINIIKVFALVCLFVKKPNYANISLKIMLILKTPWWIIKALMHVYVRRAYFNTRFEIVNLRSFVVTIPNAVELKRIPM